MRYCILLISLCVLSSFGCIRQSDVTPSYGTYSTRLKSVESFWNPTLCTETYSKASIRDIESNIVTHIIVEDHIFEAFLSYSSSDAPTSKEEYQKYKASDGQATISISLLRYVMFCNELLYMGHSSYQTIIDKMAFTTPLSLEQLGITDEMGLLRKYFEYSRNEYSNIYMLRLEYVDTLDSNPAFIATILDHGFVVSRNGQYGRLYIHKR